MTRLTHHQYYKACCAIETERDIVQSMTTAAIIAMVLEKTGIQITSSQCRDMLDSIGIERKNQVDDACYAIRAMASRLNWAWGQLVAEGKKLCLDAEAKMIADSKQAEPLPMAGITKEAGAD